MSAYYICAPEETGRLRKGRVLMTIIDKYGLSVNPDGANLTVWDGVMQGLLAKINAPETPAEKVATVDVLDAKYGKDEEGAAAARNFLRESGVLDLLVNYADDDPSRTFHLLAAVKDVVVPYFNTEVSYFRMQATPKTVTVNEKAQLRADFNGLRKIFNGLACAVSVMEGAHPAIIDKGKGPEYHVQGIRGPNTSSGEVHGKYGPVYALAWTVDGEDLPAGTPLADIVRSLWHGTDRIGKNSKDLAEMLDSLAPTWKSIDSAEFEVNGHKVEINRNTGTVSEEVDAETE